MKKNNYWIVIKIFIEKDSYLLDLYVVKQDSLIECYIIPTCDF